MKNSWFIVFLALFFLCGCASLTTTTIAPTDTTRSISTAEKVTATRFRTLQQPSATTPNLVLTVLKQATQEETFQRRHVEKQVIKPDVRPLLWLGGAAAAAGGYYLMTGTGLVMLGKNLMGLGALVPLASELVVAVKGPVSEEWKPESRTLPARTITARNTDFVASVGSSSWSVQTNNNGQLVVDVSTLVNMADPGKPLSIDFALQEDPSQTTTVTIPAVVLDAHRPAPPVITEAYIEPVSTPPPPGDISSLLTIAILDFEGIGVSAEEARVLTNRLGTHMVQLGTHQVIERGQMEQILQEQDFQLSGCTSNECAVEIGRVLGCEQMLAGSFGKIGSIYTIDMRIIDVESGGILRTTSYDVRGDVERLLTEGLAGAVRRIAGAE